MKNVCGVKKMAVNEHDNLKALINDEKIPRDFSDTELLSVKELLESYLLIIGFETEARKILKEHRAEENSSDEFSDNPIVNQQRSTEGD